MHVLLEKSFVPLGSVSARGISARNKRDAEYDKVLITLERSEVSPTTNWIFWINLVGR